MNNRSDGSTASYYELPANATELQHLISHRDMNAQIGEIFRACYRYGIASHSDRLRDAKKIKFYIDAEIERLIADSVTPSAAIARHPMTPNVVSYPAVEAGVDVEFNGKRADIVASSHGDGEHYAVTEPMRCSDCLAEHCACVVR